MVGLAWDMVRFVFIYADGGSGFFVWSLTLGFRGAGLIVATTLRTVIGHVSTKVTNRPCASLLFLELTSTDSSQDMDTPSIFRS